ncbi:type VII secretion integral membrane protein EccD (plasmid) [Mycobacterium sp. JS623]|uniref:type VII secretion integral membrane protein EccD n=1 Tax=Mycobacterium sp. JS623 TaxID=212767 RepID=UPI0002A57DFD|nr:type VII secretion integral membrane protein EccD [Mycobacterium sp. JS623]AGB27145.1 type VII secretion integral membrane protein EccD [Mycobacterium sp. JS623]
MATTQAEARVQITVPGHVIDVPMSNYMLIGDSLAELIPFLRNELERVGKDASWLADPDAHWTLRRPFHTQPLDPEKTLDAEKVRDGSRLLLVKLDPGEKYPPLIDDVAEAITYWLREHFPSWDGRVSQRVTLVVTPAVVAFVCALAIFWTSTATPNFTARLVVCTLMVIGAVLAAAISIVVVRTDKDSYTPIVAPFLTITYLLAGTAALLITPRPLGIYQLVAAGAVLFTLSVSLAVITRANARLHYGIASAAAAVTIIAALNMAYRSPTAVLGVQLIALCFLTILVSGRISLALARISLPYVPATGESYVKGNDRAGDLDAGDLPRDGRANESILNQEQQTLTAYDCIVGILTGALVTLCATGFFAGRAMDNHQWIIFAAVLTTALALLYRGKSYDDARLQGITLIATALLLAAFGAGLLASPAYADNQLRAAIVIGILVLGTLIATVYSIQQRRIVSPVVNRLLERVEWLLYAAPLVYVVLAMDLFQKARAR